MASTSSLSVPLGFPIMLQEVPVVANSFVPPATLPVDPTTVDGKMVVYSFQDRYLWAPGYTVEVMAPQMEYMGEPKIEVERIHGAFQKHISKITSTINKKKRTEAGLAEIFRDFPSYCDQLAAAYRTVGFEGRDGKYAALHLTVNMTKQKFQDRFQEVMATQADAQAVFRRFLIEEPWHTCVASLQESTFVLDESTTVAKLGSFLVSVQNGDFDTPSFHLNLEVLANPVMNPIVERLSKWFAGDCEIYELRICVGTEVPGDSKNLHVQVDRIFKNLKGVEIELFTLAGTARVAQDRKAGHEKLTTSILKGLATSEKLGNLQRLNVEDCWVDFDTLAALKGVLSKSAITSLRLAHLKLGLEPVTATIELEMVMRDGDCGDVQHRCLQCDSSCCYFPCCFCCTKVPDHAATKQRLYDAMETFHKENEQLTTGHVRGYADLCEGLRGMHSRGCVDVIDFEGTRLPDLCGTALGVNQLLKAIAMEKPTAINLKDSGLCDAHVAGVCEVFFKNPALAHFEVSLCSSSTDGLENLQNLAQNSPMLVSGGIWPCEPAVVHVASELHTEVKEESSCCLSWQSIAIKQNVNEYKFPRTPMSQGDFDVYSEKIMDEIQEHSVFPMYKSLAALWKDSPKKLKNLVRASGDPIYNQVLSPEADEPKVQLLKDFLSSVQCKVALEEMLERQAVAAMDMLTAPPSKMMQAIQDHRVWLPGQAPTCE